MSDRIESTSRGTGRTIALIVARLARVALDRPKAPRERRPSDFHAHEFDFERYVSLAPHRRGSSRQ